MNYESSWRKQVSDKVQAATTFRELEVALRVFADGDKNEERKDKYEVLIEATKRFLVEAVSECRTKKLMAFLTFKCLPDVVTAIIFGFLPSRQTAQCCIISKYCNSVSLSSFFCL